MDAKWIFIVNSLAGQNSLNYLSCDLIVKGSLSSLLSPLEEATFIFLNS